MSQAVPPDRSSSSEQAGAFSLANHFLIAMPSMTDPSFSGTVIYLCEHGPGGALGLVINKPTELTLQNLFERVDLTLSSEQLGATPVLYGGPVDTNRGFVLHNQTDSRYDSTLQVREGLVLTMSKDVLEAVAGGEGPPKMVVTLGHSAWGEGQLEQELSLNAWLTVPADPTIVFDVPHSEKLGAAMNLLGIDPLMLSDQVGHA